MNDIATRMARRSGWILLGDIRRAGTGSKYFDLSRDCPICGQTETVIRIRVSNHAECYPPNRSECDDQITIGGGGDGVSETEAVRLLRGWPPNTDHECDPEDIDLHNRPRLTQE